MTSMKTIEIPYGKTTQAASLPGTWSGDEIDSDYRFEETGFETLVRKSLEAPIGSDPLHRIVKPGDRVCIIFSDITRSWQRTGDYLPLLAEELERGGVRLEDITLLCALGTHRPHREDEKRQLAGSLYGKCPFVDHNCDDQENMVRVGTTSRGTVVEINRIAAESDHVILTGGIIFHLMAGYSGGRKSILPGISSRRTIMQNHSLSLSPVPGGGSHPDIGCDKIEGNLIHEDLEEAIDMVRPSFLLNIVPGKKGPGAAVAGHYRKAHQRGCDILKEFYKISIPEKRELVIASAGGFPGDINFYQSVKSMINSCEALIPGGTLILASSSPEGLGNPLMEEMIRDYPDMRSREEFLRNNYTIGRFIAYYGCEMASRFNVLYVSDMDEKDLNPAGISCYRTLQEAVDFYAGTRGAAPLKYWLIPDASHSFPSA